jgi:hypothetical protein
MSQPYPPEKFPTGRRPSRVLHQYSREGKSRDQRLIAPDEPEDDLDALLAEQKIYQTSAPKKDGGLGKGLSMSVPEEDFDDDMEAMAETEMEGMYS